MSQEIIIADSSCLIVLENIQELSLLNRIFGEVFITQEVKNEFGLELPEWIKVREIKNKSQQNALNLILDKGEANSITLALESTENILIIDEKKGRRIAQDLGIKIIGTLGIIIKANELGLINSIEKMFEKLEDVSFYVLPTLKKSILEKNFSPHKMKAETVLQ